MKAPGDPATADDQRAVATRRSTIGRLIFWAAVILFVVFVLEHLTGPRMGPGLSNSKTTTAEQQTRMLRSALDTMRLDIGRYPTADEGLALLVTPPHDDATAKSWRGPYIEGMVPLDPWGQPYHYSPVGQVPYPLALYSDGPPGSPPGKVIGYPPPD